MLQLSNSIFRLCIVVVVVMLVQLSPVLSQDVKIGTQVWMSKNLDVSTFRNGEAIPEAKSEEEWAKAGNNKTAAFCYYLYDSNIGKVYGKLYNWYAVNDSRGLAPKGYHIPSDAEWTILTDFLGGVSEASPKMKSKTGWSNNRYGTNSSGFNGLPGGLCYDFGYFLGITGDGYWWSSSEYNKNMVWNRHLGNYYTIVFRYGGAKKGGFSVRCIKD
jgi:uncharacterized protein (TIGR02145 family)